MVAATLFPAGLPLSGIQVFENMRAVDYLQTRPEVDPAKIGITGASGAGTRRCMPPRGMSGSIGGAGLFGRELPGVPWAGVLHVRGRARGAAVHGGVGRAGAHGVAGLMVVNATRMRSSSRSGRRRSRSP